MAKTPQTITVRLDTSEAVRQLQAIQEGLKHFADTLSTSLAVKPADRPEDYCDSPYCTYCSEKAEYGNYADAQASHDLRTSPIALKALDFYNGIEPKNDFVSWDQTKLDDDTVREWIAMAEDEQAEQAEKLNARRDAILVEVGSKFRSEDLDNGHPFISAVDRIIALEDELEAVTA